jgi:predicted nucleic acid-binding protein
MMITIARPNTVFIDTNIWLYAFIAGQNPQKTERAQYVIQTASTIIVSTQVINEVCVQLIKRVNDTEEQARAIISDFYRRYIVMELDQPILLMASALREQYRLSYWDSFIVACALTGGASTLYSEDMHDGLIIHSQLTIVNPFKSISVPEN